jgi:hypothetical protein
LGCMKSEARKLYEEYFSTAAFQEKLLAEVGNFISLRPGDSYNFLPNCD